MFLQRPPLVTDYNRISSVYKKSHPTEHGSILSMRTIYSKDTRQTIIIVHTVNIYHVSDPIPKFNLTLNLILIFIMHLNS